ncbi:hypothetical protein HO173_013056 [Letharia columbiana]|uniref:Uncharacterized protein n=1 Tax=Letharia columbiana TaxID=112416 RepID=A0A8H6FE53_9LECA|nr:uncharacterized protein HO173_013056 [Letharia columbiana]KAF6224539.1 hypothetical protein HO173_013056 [Letharia columbiana]
MERPRLPKHVEAQSPQTARLPKGFPENLLLPRQRRCLHGIPALRLGIFPPLAV